MEESLQRKIAFIGNYLPRQCGIATFTTDLCTAVASQYPEVDCFVLPINDQNNGYDYPEEVRFEIPEQDISAYQRAADFLNMSNTEVVSLQHEFGIFGGPGGEHILTLLHNLRMPVVTTLHTILPDLDLERKKVMHELIDLSTKLVVMSERGREILEEVYHVPEAKIDFIHHGIPDMPFVDPNFYKDQFDVEGKYVVLTFGLINPFKGIEYTIQALPKVLEAYPNLVYMVLGATHPALLREEGETYRESLKELTRELGIEDHVIFYNRFVELDELIQYIGAADIYVTPYLYPEQITSGTLAYTFGCGKAVISTPYWYAEELLAEDRGLLVPFRDPDAIAEKMIYMLKHEPQRHAMRKKAYMLGRQMVWPNVAQLYMKTFQEARHTREKDNKPTIVQLSSDQRFELPSIQLDQLMRLSDCIGILQHSSFHLPHFGGGYSTDENALALILMVLLDELGQSTRKVQDLSSTYAAFLNYAFDPDSQRFRTELGIDRRWKEEENSPGERQGRIAWALGTCVGRSRSRILQTWAAQLFDQAIPTMSQLQSPRACAFTLLGVHEYFRTFSGDRMVNQLRDALTQHLIDAFQENSSDDWPWFEDELLRENAKLPHALLQSGRWAGNSEAYEIGLHALRWLMELQTADEGHFRPIGYKGFYPKDGERAQFDQYPIEAHAALSACLEAYHATQEQYWFDQARKTFEWYLGHNDLGQALYDPQTGGCADALQVDRLNMNQGAQATLAFLLSLAEIHATLLRNEFKWSNIRPRRSNAKNLVTIS